MAVRRIAEIIKKEFVIDNRDKFGFLSSILYLVAITFVVFKVFNQLNGPTRIGIFWILFVFTAINIVGHSFSYHSRKRKLFYYQLYKPEEIIIAKLLSNLFKVIVAGYVLYMMQYLFSEEGIKNISLFNQTLALASWGVVVILTLSSAIASYAQDQNTLVSVLALPLLIPILMISMRLSLIADRMFVDSAINNYLMMLLGINILLTAMCVIFIPIIWKS